MSILIKEYFQTKAKLGIEATKIDLTRLLDIKMPSMSKYGIPVLNKQGYVRTSLNEYTEGFIKSASNVKSPVLEIGCAYGHVVQEVLRGEGTIVACDAGAEHLEILVQQTPAEYLNRLYLYPAEFPDNTSFLSESFDSILASRVLHFLDGGTLERGLDKMHDWLIPGGRLYFTALSVYHKEIKKHFLSSYQENIKNKIKWAGEIKDPWKFVEDHSGCSPKFLHVFDIPQLEELLPEHGFEIEKISLFNYSDDTTAGESGHIGFVARKVAKN